MPLLKMIHITRVTPRVRRRQAFTLRAQNARYKEAPFQPSAAYHAIEYCRHYQQESEERCCYAAAVIRFH